MAVNRFGVFISLLTGGVTVLNAAGFVFLAPGPQLLDYISASVLYGFSGWAVLWVVPAAFGYIESKMEEIRTTQLLLTGVGALIIIAFHPNIVGICFAALLLAEVFFFFSYLLVIQSRTAAYQRIALVRAAFNSVGLLVVIFLFDGSPIAYCLALLAVTLVVGGSVRVFNVYKVPIALAPMGALPSSNFYAMMRTRPLRCMLGGRGLEVLTIQFFGWSQNLGALICLKAGFAISQALSSNARDRGYYTVAIAASVVYLVSISSAVLLASFGVKSLPDALHHIKWTDMVFMLPIALCHCLLSLEGLRAAKR